MYFTYNNKIFIIYYTILNILHVKYGIITFCV